MGTDGRTYRQTSLKQICPFSFFQMPLQLFQSWGHENVIENVNTIDERRSKIVKNRVFDCHLSPGWRQMAIENTTSSDFFIRVRRLLSAFSTAAWLMSLIMGYCEDKSSCHMNPMIMSLDGRKSVVGASDQVRLKLACSATKTS